MLVTVTSCGALVAPARWLPKFKLAGESEARGMTPAPFTVEMLLRVPDTVREVV